MASFNPILQPSNNNLIHYSQTNCLDTGYIGNSKAAQKYSNDLGDKDPFKYSHKIFNQVINSNKFNDVGGFHITVKVSEDQIEHGNLFLSFFEYYLYNEALNTSCNNTIFEMTTDTPENGGYAMNYFQDYKGNNSGMGIYFPHGKCGVIFGGKPRNTEENLLKANVLQAQTAQDFILKALEQRGLIMKGYEIIPNTQGAKPLDMQHIAISNGSKEISIKDHMPKFRKKVY